MRICKVIVSHKDMQKHHVLQVKLIMQSIFNTQQNKLNSYYEERF